MFELIDKLTKLAELGYMVTIPANGVCISVMGYNGNYYKAKNQLANTITADLNRLPFITAAWNTKHMDGFYDFFCK